MGMSASQARLLSLTARLHDVEHQAQLIMSQKIALATQKDALYEEYNNALDATVIQVAFMNDAKTEYKDANYTSVCTYQESRCKQYALRDNSTGLLLVTDEVKEAYDNFGNDKYAFAYAMMGFDRNFNWGYTPEESGMFIGIGISQSKSDGNLNYIQESDGSYSLYMSQCEQMVYDKHCNEKPELKEKYEAITKAETTADKKKALSEFRDYLYKQYPSEIYDYMNLDKQESQEKAQPCDERTWEEISKEFNYYVNLWSAINESGGCTTIDPQFMSGDEGTEWFNNMVNSGLATIMVFDEYNGKTKGWSDTSVATSTNNNYLQEVSDDTDLKKAEAKYQHELDIINRKDTKFDNDLNNLETERTAITTEIDSIEKVRDDNIDRTFGIFS